MDSKNTLCQTLNYYSIYDRVACEFAPFFIAKNDADAWRGFILQGKKSEVPMEDYDLYFMGRFTNLDASCNGMSFDFRPYKVVCEKEND